MADIGVTDTVQTTTVTDASGNTYTTGVQNDSLTSEDFLDLMLTELKYQDPTKPMDSDKMLDDQMQLSTIDANTKMTEAMQSLEKSYTQSAISTSASMIGQVVEKGVAEDGKTYQYLISSVEQNDGEIILNGKMLTGKDDDGNVIVSDENTQIQYNEITKIMKGM